MSLPKPRRLPDLRRLRLDLVTPIGTYATGTVVEALGSRRDTLAVRVCLDGPGFHLGACKQAWLPPNAVTRCALVPSARGGVVRRAA